MKSFNLNLRPESRHTFKRILKIYTINKLREQLTYHILTSEPGAFFDITDIDRDVVDQACEELKKMKWKIKFLFNDTAIVIFDKDDELVTWGEHLE